MLGHQGRKWKYCSIAPRFFVRTINSSTEVAVLKKPNRGQLTQAYGHIHRKNGFSQPNPTVTIHISGQTG